MTFSVLFVHNRYQERGGEDSVYETESALLEARGHRVGRLEFDNHDLPVSPSPLQRVQLATDTVWSRHGQKRLQEALDAFQPDVVHFHNTLPQVSPAAYRVARRSGAAVVQTLHNFRLACPSGLMYREGRPCESCVSQAVPLSGIIHGCYRGSRSQTAAVAAMLTIHRAIGTWNHDVDLYLAPSAFAKQKVAAAGVQPERIMVKPNFAYPDPGPGEHQDDFVLFASRVTETKGIHILLEAYRKHAEGLPDLVVAHSGDLVPEVQRAASHDPRITFMGQVPRDEVIEMMGRARALVFPSIWYENFPMAITEAFSRGLPVVGSRIGALPELIEDGVTGLLYEPLDAADLAAKLRTIRAGGPHIEAMSTAAREAFVSRYSADRAYELLMEAYERATGRPSLLKQNRDEPRFVGVARST